MGYSGIFIGRVTNNSGDPLSKDGNGLGRVQVRVPHVYGSGASDAEGVSDADLPWAIPFGLPNGGTDASGGVSWVPNPGDQVAVMFLDGDPEQPMYAPCMQPLEHARVNKVHRVDKHGVPVKEKREKSFSNTKTSTPKAYTIDHSEAIGVRLSSGEDNPPLIGLPPVDELPALPGVDSAKVLEGEEIYRLGNPTVSKMEAGAAYRLSNGVSMADGDHAASVSMADMSTMLDANFKNTPVNYGPYPKTLAELDSHPRANAIRQQMVSVFVTVTNAADEFVTVPVKDVTDAPAGALNLAPATYDNLRTATSVGGGSYAPEAIEVKKTVFFYKMPRPDTNPASLHQ